MPGAHVTFSNALIPASSPAGISFTPPSTVRIDVSGVYDIEYYAIPQNSNITLALFVNSTEIAGTRYTDTSSAGNLTGQALVEITAPAALTLRNVDTMQTAKIDNGQLSNTVSASILITQVG